MSAPKQDAKPIIATGIMTEFGELQDDPNTLMDPMGMNGDLSYVPGFSDMRRDRDLARSQGLPGKDLPVNMRWFRRTRANGQPTNERTVRGRNQGYRAVTQADVGQPWMTEIPPGAEVLPDGSIANADQILMVCDQRRAAKNAAGKVLRMLEQTTGSTDGAIERAIAKDNKRVPTGSAPEVTRELGSPQK